ncbi:MAG: DUF1553 domain-containing protein [Planctomycetes bacterium]|nr:DUF1553 domain-containing protein [Planctomycetota bacterium]
MSRRRSTSNRVARVALWGALTLGLSVALAEPPGNEVEGESSPVSSAALTSGVVLQAFPAVIDLSGARDRAGLILVARYPDGSTADVTTRARWRLAAPLARISSGTLFPLAAGQTTLELSLYGQRLEVAVRVRQPTKVRPVTFGQDVLPALTRAGCNTGSCHGSSRGKEGFRLSLFGYDPAGDYQRLTRELSGRRVDLSAALESLMLAKGGGSVRHGGGQRLDPSGESYRLIQEWIAAGAPADPRTLPKLIGIELSPPAAVLLEGEGSQRLVVRARYADGSDRDVTRFATLIPTDARTAGLVGQSVVAGVRGESWIMARYGQFTVASSFSVVPSEPLGPPAKSASAHWIDRLVDQKLRALRIDSSPVCDDATFLRRVTLDLSGRLPTADEARAFLADATPNKRTRWVDKELKRKEFAEVWVQKWAERLLVKSVPNQVSRKAALRYFAWLEARVAGNVPLDQIVRELLTAQGGVFEAPAVNFYQAERNGLKVAENVAQVFLGMRLQCAQCHNHPFDRWTQDDYYGWAAFFSQIGRKRGADPREVIVFDRRRGEVKHPVTKRNVAPRFLGGEAPKTRGKDRRAVAAEWITSPENPYFSRNAANLVWEHFFGVGIVHEPDDVRVSNPPRNPALLDALAERLIDVRYDLRKLVREIVTSQTYQRSVQATARNSLDDRNASHARVRRMRAEVLLDALSQVTGAPTKFPGLPLGARALRIPDGATTSYFLTTFGRSRREGVCTCEVRTEPNLGQALHLLNGASVSTKIRQGRLVARLLKAKRTPAQILDELYLRALSRFPTVAERDALLRRVEAGPALASALEDVLWALLNSKEFLFQH